MAGVTAGQMLMVAVGWQMYDLTGSPWDLGLVGLLLNLISDLTYSFVDPRIDFEAREV